MLCPPWQALSLAITRPGIHCPEDLTDNVMSIGRISGTHLFDGTCKQAFVLKNIRVFGKKTKDQSSHEMVHFMALLTATPVRIIFKQFDVKAVKATGGSYIKGTVTNLLYCGDARQRQEEAEVVWKLLIFTGNRLAGFEIFGFEISAVCRENEACFGPSSRGALP